MTKQYRSPTLTEYGRIDRVTAGATGSQPDYYVVGNQLVPNPTNPNCITNVQYCAVTGS